MVVDSGFSFTHLIPHIKGKKLRNATCRYFTITINKTENIIVNKICVNFYMNVLNIYFSFTLAYMSLIAFLFIYFC